MVASVLVFNSSQCPRYTRYWGRRLGWFDVEWFRSPGVSRALVAAFVVSAASGVFVVESYGATRDTAQLQLTGNIPPTCSFTTLPGVTDLGDLSLSGPRALGSFGFTCNLATSGAVQLTVQSANGALKRDGGTDAAAQEACGAGGCVTPSGFVKVAGDVSLAYALEAMMRRRPETTPRIEPLLKRLRGS